MAEYRIRLQLDGLPAVRAAIYQQVYPLLTEAVKAVALQTSVNWQAAVQDAKLWVGEKDAYAASIQVKMTGAFSSCFTLWKSGSLNSFHSVTMSRASAPFTAS